MYQVLGITRNSSTSEIRKAFRRKALESHPDKGGRSDWFREVVTAFETLSDSSKRAEYDALHDGFGGHWTDASTMPSTEDALVPEPASEESKEAQQRAILVAARWTLELLRLGHDVGVEDLSVDHLCAIRELIDKPDSNFSAPVARPCDGGRGGQTSFGSQVRFSWRQSEQSYEVHFAIECIEVYARKTFDLEDATDYSIALLHLRQAFRDRTRMQKAFKEALEHAPTMRVYFRSRALSTGKKNTWTPSTQNWRIALRQHVEADRFKRSGASTLDTIRARFGQEVKKDNVEYSSRLQQFRAKIAKVIDRRAAAADRAEVRANRAEARANKAERRAELQYAFRMTDEDNLNTVIAVQAMPEREVTRRRTIMMAPFATLALPPPRPPPTIFDWPEDIFATTMAFAGGIFSVAVVANTSRDGKSYADKWWHSKRLKLAFLSFLGFDQDKKTTTSSYGRRRRPRAAAVVVKAEERLWEFLKVRGRFVSVLDLCGCRKSLLESNDFLHTVRLILSMEKVLLPSRGLEAAMKRILSRKLAPIPLQCVAGSVLCD